MPVHGHRERRSAKWHREIGQGGSLDRRSYDRSDGPFSSGAPTNKSSRHDKRIGAIAKVAMSNYTQRVRNSILPLSVAGTLPEAIAEWRFTGETEDHEEPVEICLLCGQDWLRYHFEICNDFSHHRLEVGSHCMMNAMLSARRAVATAERCRYTSLNDASADLISRICGFDTLEHDF